MKWYNGLFSVKQWNDDEREDYDSYFIGVQVQEINKEEAQNQMFDVMQTFDESLDFGCEWKFEGFCSEYEFDIVGCDVL